MSPLLAMVLAPMLVARELAMLIEMVSLALEPTWKASVPKVPSSSLRPPKVVVSAMRLISCCSCETSACSAARSVPDWLPLADWIDSSRMRCSSSPVSASAPSAVCDSEMPSLALRTAWFRPRICEVKRLLMASPAASSLALLMRRPEDSRCSEVASDCPLLSRLRCAFSDGMFVLMICGMVRLRSAAPAGAQCWLSSVSLDGQPPIAALASRIGAGRRKL
jgi:hypothetical protein